MQTTTDPQNRSKTSDPKNGEKLQQRRDPTLQETLSNCNSYYGRRISKSQKNILRHATKDGDTESKIKKEHAFVTNLFRATAPNLVFMCANIAVFTVWSCVCAWGADKLKAEAANDPSGKADRWMGYLENTSDGLKTIGVLFTFSLIFRFNVCYHRWWEGRVYWGSMISACLDLAQMNRKWIADMAVADRISRFIIVYAYACKSQLRGKSLCENGESGIDLVKKGILTEEELRNIGEYPCWQPYYAMDMIRHAWIHAYGEKGNALCLAYDHKAYTQLFRSFDNALVKLSDLIGDSIRVRASGLPKSYDTAHFATFYMFFFLAPVSWSVSMGWLTPAFVAFAIFINLSLMLMGTAMVDPFGYDAVDLPLDCFCETIEVQILEIDARTKRGDLRSFAREAKSKSNSVRNPFQSSCSYKIDNLS